MPNYNYVARKLNLTFWTRRSVKRFTGKFCVSTSLPRRKKAQKSAQKHGQNGWQINRELVNNPIPIPKHRPGPRRQRFWTTSECECYKARMLLACCCCCCYAVAVAAAALLLPLVWTAPCNYLTTTECGNYVSRYILAKRVAGVAAKRGPIIKHITIITITLRSQREGARDRESAWVGKRERGR